MKPGATRASWVMLATQGMRKEPVWGWAGLWRVLGFASEIDWTVLGAELQMNVLGSGRGEAGQR